MFKTISPEEIIEGMELAVPVMNKLGQVLLAENLKLLSKHTGLLKTWGVRTIQVYSSDTDENSEIEESVLLDAKKILSERMKWEPRNLNEEDLAEMALNRILETKF